MLWLSGFLLPRTELPKVATTSSPSFMRSPVAGLAPATSLLSSRVCAVLEEAQIVGSARPQCTAAVGSRLPSATDTRAKAASAAVVGGLVATIFIGLKSLTPQAGETLQDCEAVTNGPDGDCSGFVKNLGPAWRRRRSAIPRWFWPLLVLCRQSHLKLRGDRERRYRSCRTHFSVSSELQRRTWIECWKRMGRWMLGSRAAEAVLKFPP